MGWLPPNHTNHGTCTVRIASDNNEECGRPERVTLTLAGHRHKFCLAHAYLAFSKLGGAVFSGAYKVAGHYNEFAMTDKDSHHTYLRHASVSLDALTVDADTGKPAGSSGTRHDPERPTTAFMRPAEVLETDKPPAFQPPLADPKPDTPKGRITGFNIQPVPMSAGERFDVEINRVYRMTKEQAEAAAKECHEEELRRIRGGVD